jgi:hypothetical protein
MTTPVANMPHSVSKALDRRMRLFAGLWAIGHVIHLMNDDGKLLTNIFSVTVVFAAVRLLANPGSLRRLAFLAATQLAHVAWTAPLLPDHWILAAAVNGAILVSLATAALRERSWLGLSNGSALFGSMMPALRVILLISYTAAAIAKYNTTFLEPVTSCATWLTQTATGGLVGTVDALGPLHVLTAIVPETAIPILLLVPRTRRFGVRFAIGFHLLLAISPLLVVGDFSVILTALFLLFGSDEDVEAVLKPIRQRLKVDPLAKRVRSLDRPLAVSVGLTALIVVVGRTANTETSLWVWLAFIFVVPRVLLSLLRVPGGLAPPGSSLGRISVPHAVPVVLLLIWVLSPYAGYRTTGVFTMFSNLRTEGAGTNHLFMPSYHPSDHQTDLIFPGLGSSEGFDDLIENGQAVSAFEVRRVMSDSSSLTVAGTRNGEPIGDVDLEDFRQPNSFLANRLLQMRPVPMTDDPPCIN